MEIWLKLRQSQNFVSTYSIARHQELHLLTNSSGSDQDVWDIFDKLDDERVQQIVKLVSENNFGQVFITDTQRKRIENIFKDIKIEHKKKVILK